jgi:protein SCO1/2
MSRTLRWLLGGLAAGLAVAAVIGGATLALRPRHQFAGLVKDPPAPAPDFALTDETGAPFRLSDLRGQWVLLAYGYTTCPDVCPVTLSYLSAVKRDLGPAGEQARIVFVSIDPERDTVAVMGEYVNHFGTGIKGLTGTPEQVAAAAAAYGAKYERSAVTSAAGYLMNHSAYVYVIDPEFRWRETWPFGVRPPEMQADLEWLFSHRVEAE